MADEVGESSVLAIWLIMSNVYEAKISFVYISLIHMYIVFSK